MESKIKVLGLDFETQDADPKTTNITEVGACLYEVDLETNEWKKLHGFSTLCYEPDYPPQTQKIIDLTGITDQMLLDEGASRADVFNLQLLPLVQQADIIMAHKTSFDWTIFLAQCTRMGVTPPVKELLCTLTNFPWPKRITCLKLSHIAYEHSILIDPATLHRAENDVDLMVHLVASKYNFKDVLAYARKPWIYLKADILAPWIGKGGDGGIQKGIAVGLGFSYETVKGTDFPVWPKKWVGRFKGMSYEEICDAVSKSPSPFRVDIIEGIN